MLVLVQLQSDVNVQMITLKKNKNKNNNLIKKIQKYTKISKNGKEKYINASGKKTTASHAISLYVMIYLLLHDYCQGFRPGKDLKEINNYATICPFLRQQMYNGPLSNHVPICSMAMPASLKENVLILFTIPSCVPKRRAFSETNTVHVSAEHR